jgi:hypothetical protein
MLRPSTLKITRATCCRRRQQRLRRQGAGGGDAPPGAKGAGRATLSTNPADDARSNKMMKKAPPKLCKPSLKSATK